jgi:hypothetical protein
MIDPDLIAKKVHLTLGSGQKVPSPCTSVCRMDATTGWCEGCLRRLEEIGLWSSMDDAARRAVWVRIGERAQTLKASA